MAKAFSRAAALFAALAAVASNAFTPYQFQLANTPYHSRGKGLGKHSGKKWGPTPSGKYDGVTNGKDEVARRRRQIAVGILKAS